MKTLIFQSIMLLAILCGIANAQVGVVFQDNFENVAAVQYPDETQSAKPSAQIGSWSNWATSTPQWHIQVANNEVPGPASDGENFLAFYRGTDAPTIVGNFAHAPDSSEIVTIEFDYYFPSTNTGAKGTNFAVMESTTSFSNAPVLFFLEHGAWNGIRLRVGTTYYTAWGDAFARDTWHPVRVEINLTSSTYDVTISGVTYSDIPLAVSASNLSRFYFAGMYQESLFYLDNVVVTGQVPQPPAIVGNVFSDDFENVPAVQWPDPTQEADPVAGIGSWSQLVAHSNTGLPQPEGIQVSNNDPPGPAGDGLNHLTFHRDHYSFMVASWAKEVDVSDGLVVIEFDYYYPSGGADWKGMNFAVQEWTTYSANDMVVFDVFMYSSTFGVNGGFRFVQNGVNYMTPFDQPFAADTWHRVRYDIDLTANTYSVTISGKKYANLSLRKSASSLGHMYFAGYAAGTIYHLDNIAAGVLQPVCLAPMRADLTGDCQVGMDDFAEFLDYWLTDSLN